MSKAVHTSKSPADKGHENWFRPVMEIIRHFTKSAEEFITASVGKFWASLHSCGFFFVFFFNLELHTDGRQSVSPWYFQILYL